MLIDGKLQKNPKNYLSKIIEDEQFRNKTCFEFKNIEFKITDFAKSLFMGVGAIGGGQTTLRFCPTTEEGLHFDTFKVGESGAFKRGVRAFKLFLNVDKKPRVWRIGPALADFITINQHHLPNPCPDDVNTFCYVVDKLGLLDNCETRQVEIPPGGMVIANGTSIAHEVVSGDRMVCLETFVTALPGRPPIRSTQEEFLAITEELGIPMVKDFPGLEALANQDGSFERTKKRLAEMA